MNTIGTSRNVVLGTIGFITVTLIATLAALDWTPDRPVRTAQSSTETPTTLPPTAVPTVNPYEGEPLLTAQEAITKSLQLFPANHNAHGVVAKLISFQTFSQQWLGPQYQVGGASPTDAVWLVGILGDNLIVGDTLALGPAEVIGITPAQADPRPAEGMYCAFQAGSGGRLATGALIVNSPMRSYNLLQALPTEVVPIVRPTIDPQLLQP